MNMRIIAALLWGIPGFIGAFMMLASIYYEAKEEKENKKKEAKKKLREMESFHIWQQFSDGSRPFLSLKDKVTK